MSVRIWADGMYIDIDKDYDLLQRKCSAALTLANALEEENKILKKRISMCLNELHSDLERQRYDTFVAEHMPCRDISNYYNNWPYIRQYSSNDGDVTKVYCPVCGKSEDITDREDENE